MKQISKITNAQISSRGVQALADKPNATSQYGVAGLSPAGLKQWFDQLASFIAQKVNTIIDTLSADDCAEYIKVVLDNSDYESLDDVLKSFESGEFASELVKLYPSVTSNTLTTLQSVINTIASSISTLTEGLNNAVYRLDHNTLVPVESTLSETSTNTIQNKVVAKALNKQNSGSATTHTLTTRAGGIELQRVVGATTKDSDGIHSSGSMGCVDLGSLNYTVIQTGTANERFKTTLPNANFGTTINVKNIVCTIYANKDVGDVANHTEDMICGGYGSDVQFYNASLIGKSTSEIKSAMSGIYLAYETSSTPSAYALPITEHNADSTQTHSVVIPLTEPLYTQNEIVKQNGKWGVLKKYGCVDLGTLSWRWHSAKSNWITTFGGYKFVNNDTKINAIAEKYTADTVGNVYSNITPNSISGEDGTQLRVNNGGSESVSPSGKLIYELATPTFTPFADQKPCYELESFDGQTVITSDGLAKLSVGYGTSDVMALTIKNMNDIAILKEGE